MAWYDEAVFYHIYPLGLLGAPKQNPYGSVEHRIRALHPWIDHIKEIGCNAIYIGPLFESVGHGYETTDYRKLDSRLGDNEDLKSFVSACHAKGIRVIFDGVFNHTGRDFFAFQDIRQNRENSRYRDWYCNVNFWGNNEYNDGFSYENWGGYNLLVKLNQKNPEVINYICDVIRFWASEFDVDGIRLDAADVLDMQFMQALRGVANEVKPEFWLMGEVIHGEYSRWANEGTLHSVTNYHLHKALYSGHNDHNYFEIAHTVRRLYDMGRNCSGGLKLYNFVDNHDVERIYTKLNNKAHFAPVHVLLYTLPGIPSLYYGSEFGIEGRKERFSDDSLRPALQLEDFKDAVKNNPCTALVAALGQVRQQAKALSYGDYKELTLTNRQYAFSRSYEGQSVLVTVNNDDQAAGFRLPAGGERVYTGALTGEKVYAQDGWISVSVQGNSGEIWLPGEMEWKRSEDKVLSKTAAKTEAQPDAAAEEKIRKNPVTETEMPKGAEKEADVQLSAATEKNARQGMMMEEQDQAAAGKRVQEVAAEGVTAGRDVQKITAGRDEQEAIAERNVHETAAGDSDAVTEEKARKGEASGEKMPQDSDIAEQGAGMKGKAAEAISQGSVTKEKENRDAADTCRKVTVPSNKSYEKMTVEELQTAVLEKMAKNGPVTDEMRRTVDENIWHGSLVNWVKSFR